MDKIPTPDINAAHDGIDLDETVVIMDHEPLTQCTSKTFYEQLPSIPMVSAGTQWAQTDHHIHFNHLKAYDGNKCVLKKTKRPSLQLTSSLNMILKIHMMV